MSENGWGTSTVLSGPTNIVVERPDLAALAEKWLPLLGLRDWHVETMYCNDDQMSGDYGTIVVNREHRTAVLRVKHPEDWNARAVRVDRESVERTLVHELLHIWFKPFESDDPEKEIAIEQAINALSKVLVTDG